jgi:predicted metal-dependent hydrolase
MTALPYKCGRVQFGSRELRYSVRIARSKDIAITVQPDLSVEVAAPAAVTDEVISQCVQRRAAWITKHLVRLESFPPVPGRRKYVSGETFRYLGREYRLKVDRGRQSRVRLCRPFLLATVFDHPSARADRLVQRWYRERANEVLNRRLSECLGETRLFVGLSPTLRICCMTRRWGSCTREGVVTLHPGLIQAPVSAIDYVITHELCHLRILNHGPEFFRLLARVMPDWRARRTRLLGINPAE